MPALEIRRDRTPVMLRKLAKAEADARVARRLLAIANALDGVDRKAAAEVDRPLVPSAVRQHPVLLPQVGIVTADGVTPLDYGVSSAFPGVQGVAQAVTEDVEGQ